MKFVRYLILLTLLLAAGCKRPSSETGGSSEEMVLHHRLQAKVQTLDPANIGDVSSHAVGSEIFECLYEYHYLKRPYELIPSLAETLPQVSQDNLEYRISIKKGVFFHDDKCFDGGMGRELKAGDFVFAWKRIADIKALSKMWWIFDNRIVGLDEFREYTKTCKRAKDVDYTRPVEGIAAVDDYTILIRLKKPWPQIIDMLAYPATAPMAKEAVDFYGDTTMNHPVGTGPFMLKAWDRGSYIEMVRNLKYRVAYYPSEGEPGDEQKGLLRDAGRQMPFVDRIIWHIVTEDQPRWLMFLQGDIDITGIPKDNFGQAISIGMGMTEEMEKRNIRLDTFEEPDTFYVGFNMEDPVLGKNKPLRLAISCAFDREKWIELFYNGRGKIAYGYILPIMKGYDPNIIKVSKTEYDPEKARELVKQAVKIHGGPLPELKLTMSGTDTTYRQMGQFLQSAMEQIGLKVQAEYMDWPTYLEKLRTKSTQIYQSGWMADIPDVENFMQIFYSKSAPWPNSSNYSNPEFDRIYEQISVMQDCDERTELYRQAERIVVEDAPAAFLYHRIFYVMYHEWVENFKANAYKPDSFGYGLSKYYRIDSGRRKAYQ
ncbi:MAG: hypothetical protein E4H40_02260, partial [Candidatus Brocadiia bacterium]